MQELNMIEVDEVSGALFKEILAVVGAIWGSSGGAGGAMAGYTLGDTVGSWLDKVFGTD
jgi:hypothetical protein